jgi:DNA-directed RNA polymerase subunit RPC12/RpoP
MSSELEPCVLGALCLEPSAVTGSSEAAAMVELLKPPAVTHATESAVLRSAVTHSGQASGSSDGPHAGREGRDIRTSSAKYQCVRCEVRFYKYDVYINLDQPSIAGKGLNLMCRDCFNERGSLGYTQLNELDTWTNLCKVQWLKFAFQTDEFYAMSVRSLSAVAGDAGIEYPGELHRDVGLIRKSTRLAVSISAGLNHFTAQQQWQVVKVIDRWVDEWSNEEEVPEYIPFMASDEPISDLVTEFVDQVLPGLERHMICRQKHCSMVCRWPWWIHNKPNEQYRCPACGEEFSPWKAKPTYWTTNMVFVIYDDVSLQQESDSLEPTELAGHLDKHQIMILPIMWPDTSKHLLMERVTAIFRSLDRDLKILAPKDRLGFVLRNLALDIPPRAWVNQRFSQNTQDNIDRLNDELDPRKSRWQYDEINKGYLGVHLGPEHDLDYPLDQMEFVRLWGHCYWLTRMAAASLSLGQASG